MQVKYLGHSGFLVTLEGQRIVFDPFISPNELAQGKISVDDIEADYMLLTHGHADHVADAESIARRTDATLVSNYEIVSWYTEQKGLSKAHPMNHGGSKQFEFGKVKYVNAVHSSVLPDGTYGGNPGGFVITSKDKNFYHAGDTALTLDMQLIPQSGIKLDLAMLPVGDNFTMGYEDAAMAAEMIQCDTIIAMHYDTFGYIQIDHQKAVDAFQAKGKELIFMEIGEERTF
jgi:L-ascorbate metabolism protein UlaG (beta-lactamase superfamily)